MEGQTTAAAIGGAIVGGLIMGAIIIFGYRALIGKILERFSAGVGVQVETKVAAALEEPTRQAKDNAFSMSDLIATFRENGATLTRVIDIVQASNDVLKSQNAQVEQVNASFRARLAEYTETTGTLLQAQSDLTREVEALKLTDEQQQAQIDRIGKERDQAIAERDMYKGRAEQAEELAEQANDKSVKLEAELTQLREQVATLTTKHEAEVIALNTRIDDQQRQINELKTQMAELSAELQKTREERDDYKRQRDEALDIVRQKDEQIATLTAELTLERANGAKPVSKAKREDR